MPAPPSTGSRKRLTMRTTIDPLTLFRAGFNSFDALSWTRHKGMVGDKGQPLEFDRDHRFLADVLMDDSPEIIIAKAAQMGFTTIFLLKGIYHNILHCRDVLYSTTRDETASAVVRTKLDPIASLNHLGGGTETHGSVHLKKFGKGYFHIVSSKSESASLTVSCDIVMNDEYDRSDTLRLSEFESRLQHSSFKRVWRFGNPDRPAAPGANNILSLLETSDSKYWFVHCPCEGGEYRGWQYLSWPESFCPERQVYQCKHCHAAITDQQRRDGMWVKKYSGPGRGSGYWAPLFIAPWVSAKDVITLERRMREEKANPAYCPIFVFATGYAPKDDSISELTVRTAFIKGHPTTFPVAMGIDQGGEHYCVVGGTDGVHNIFRLQSFDAIERYLDDHPMKSVVIDALPQVEAAMKLTQRYPGIVRVAFYPNEPRTPANLDVIRWHGDAPRVDISRTRHIDNCVTALRKREAPVYSTGIEDKLEEFVRHFTTMYATLETDPKGNVTRRWISQSADHFAHAYGYFRVALERARNTMTPGFSKWREGEPSREDAHGRD